MSRSTFVNYRSAWRSKVSPKWANRAMNKVRVEEYQRWLDKFTAAQAHVSHIIVLNLVNCARLHDVDGISIIDAKYKMPREKRTQATAG